MLPVYQLTDPKIPAPEGCQSKAQIPRGYFPLIPPHMEGVDLTKIPVWSIL
jgi:hypothetical protein